MHETQTRSRIRLFIGDLAPKPRVLRHETRCLGSTLATPAYLPPPASKSLPAPLPHRDITSFTQEECARAQHGLDAWYADSEAQARYAGLHVALIDGAVVASDACGRTTSNSAALCAPDKLVIMLYVDPLDA